MSLFTATAMAMMLSVPSIGGQSVGDDHIDVGRLQEIMGTLRQHRLQVRVPSFQKLHEPEIRAVMAEYSVGIVSQLASSVRSWHDRYANPRYQAPPMTLAGWEDETRYFDHTVFADVDYLVREFSPELVRMRIDPKELDHEINQCRSLAKATSILVDKASASQEFPDTPENHWAYEAVKNYKKSGLWTSYPDRLTRGQWIEMRRNFVEYTFGVVSNVHPTLLRFQHEGEERLAGRSASSDIDSFGGTIHFMKTALPVDVQRMAKEFADEFKFTGTNTDSLLAAIQADRPLMDRVEKLLDLALAKKD